MDVVDRYEWSTAHSSHFPYRRQAREKNRELTNATLIDCFVSGFSRYRQWLTRSWHTTITNIKTYVTIIILYYNLFLNEQIKPQLIRKRRGEINDASNAGAGTKTGHHLLCTCLSNNHQLISTRMIITKPIHFSLASSCYDSICPSCFLIFNLNFFFFWIFRMWLVSIFCIVFISFGTSDLPSQSSTKASIAGIKIYRSSWYEIANR